MCDYNCTEKKFEKELELHYINMYDDWRTDKEKMNDLLKLILKYSAIKVTTAVGVERPFFEVYKERSNV